MYSHTLFLLLRTSSELDLSLCVCLPLAVTPSLINILNFYTWRRARRLPLRRLCSRRRPDSLLRLLDLDANVTLICVAVMM